MPLDRFRKTILEGSFTEILDAVHEIITEIQKARRTQALSPQSRRGVSATGGTMGKELREQRTHR